MAKRSLEEDGPAKRQAVDGAWVVAGKPVLTLEAADEMCNAALKEAKARKFADISVPARSKAGDHGTPAKPWPLRRNP